MYRPTDPLFPILALLALHLTSAANCLAPRSCNPLVPSTYLSTAFTATRPQLDTYARKSIDALLKLTNPDNGEFKQGGGFYWQSHNGWTTVAEYDATRGTKVYEKQMSAAQDSLAKSTGEGTPLVNEFNDDAGWAGLGNLRAYAAYGDVKYLDRAKAVWEYLNTQYIDQGVLDKGYLASSKNPDNKVAKTCNGKSMIGGVYWVNGLPKSPERASDANVNAVSTGLFAQLGAELCEITKDKLKYCTKAYLSVQWIDNHLMTPEGLVQDGLKGGSCELTNWVFTYNAALYISTYALLGSISSNTTATGLAERTAKESIRTKQWNADNGIIIEGSGNANESDQGMGFKSILIRSLYRSYPFFKDEGLKSAIIDYINIQYYAITQLDADSKSEPVNYGRNWAGPYSVSSANAQLAALDVVNAITINPKGGFLKAEQKGMAVIKQEKRVSGC